MYSLRIGEKEYKVKFGFNSFCDTDLMDRTKTLIMLFKSEGADSDDDVSGLGKIRDLFVCVRDLMYVGFQKYNPVDSPQDVGNLLDQYHDEGTEEDPHGIMDLFSNLSGELMSEGFLADLMKAGEETQKRPRAIARKK